MHARAISYGPDDDCVALGGPQGQVEVHTVREADGGPEALVATVRHHTADVVQVAFTPAGELVSAAADGSWALSEARSGRVLRAGGVGRAEAHASLSPSGRFLFLSSCVAGCPRAFRVELATGETLEGPPLHAHPGAPAHVFALDDGSAAYHFHRDGEEGLLLVDFRREAVVRRLFRHTSLRAPAAGAGAPVLDVCPALGLGVRRDYAPLETLAAGGRAWLLLKLEVFALPTLEPLRSLAAVGFRVEDGAPDVREVWTSPEGSQAYLEARDRLLEGITGVRLAPARHSAWAALEGGRVREVGLTGDWRSPLVQHGGPLAAAQEEERGRARGRAPLAVSPSGQRLAFGLPNAFFDLRHLELEGAGVRLPRRPARAPVVEAPEFVGFTEGGAHLVLARGDEVFLLDAQEGEEVRRFALEPGSGEVTGASLSPDGRHLALSLTGAEPLLLGLTDGSVTGLGGPAHTQAARFLPDGRLLLVHHHGALAVADVAAGRWAAHRAGDEGPEGTPLSPREEASGFACWPHGEGWLAAVCDARDGVQTYGLSGGRVTTGRAFRVEGSARLVACDGAWLAVGGRGALLLLDVRSGECRHVLPVEEPLLLERGERSGTLLVFDRASGVLCRLSPETGTLVPLHIRHGRVVQVAVSEAAGRMAVLEQSGALHLAELESGLTVALLELCAEGAGGRGLRRRRPGRGELLSERRAGARGVAAPRG